MGISSSYNDMNDDVPIFNEEEKRLLLELLHRESDYCNAKMRYSDSAYLQNEYALLISCIEIIQSIEAE